MGGQSSGPGKHLIVPPRTRVALPEGNGFAIHEPSFKDFPDFRKGVTDLVLEALDEAGTPSPAVALQEIVDNLVHAVPCTATIVVDPSFNRIYVSDTGPGITRLDLALEPGYSTATEEQRALIRGVGLGFYLAQKNLEDLGGALRVSSEPGVGTYICMTLAPEITSPRMSHEVPDNLTYRQNNILFLLSELEKIGPSGVASELGISLSTAYRELIKLERLGLVESLPDGKRFLSDTGKSYLQSLLSL